MKRTTEIAAAALFVAAMAIAGAAQAQDAGVDRLLASQCAQCHGTNGAAVGGAEDLAGKDFDDLFDDLIEMHFKFDPDEIMERQAQGYSEDQLRRIAEYYASLPESSNDER